MPYTRQTNAQRGGRGGRGRGRGGRRHGGNRRRYNKNNDKPVKKKFVEKCPFIVGTAEWAKWSEVRSDYSPKIYVGTTLDPEFIPRLSTENSRQEKTDNMIVELQQEMMDNNWSLRGDDNDEFFTHNQYPNMKVPVHNHVAMDGRIFKIPLMTRSDDPLGLGCCIEYTPPNTYYSIKSNRYIGYGESRAGKRREHYLVYLGRRLKKKEEFQKEAEAIAKAMELKKRQMNKTISNV